MKFWQSIYNPQLKLTQQDLLDISEEITQKYAPHDIHHQPELVLMPVDPINLYAYWSLREKGTDNISKHIDKQLVMRIYSIPELSENPSNFQLSFDINVYGFQNQQKVHLPVAATAYSAVIGEINADNSFSVLATSDTIHVPRENPVSENSINDNDKTIQINQTLEDNFVTDHTPIESSAFDNNIHNNKNTELISQTLENNFVIEENTHDTQAEAFILKNFNDYGYDLKVYENKFNPEIKNILLKQGINIQLSTKKTNTINKNTSGQGRFL